MDKKEKELDTIRDIIERNPAPSFFYGKETTYAAYRAGRVIKNLFEDIGDRETLTLVLSNMLTNIAIKDDFTAFEKLNIPHVSRAGEIKPLKSYADKLYPVLDALCAQGFVELPQDRSCVRFTTTGIARIIQEAGHLMAEETPGFSPGGLIM